MGKRTGLKGSLIAAALGTVLLLPAVGIGGSAALTEGGNLKVQAVNSSEPSIRAVTGMQSEADEIAENPRVVRCFIGYEPRDIALDQALRDLTIENLPAYLAVFEAGKVAGSNPDVSAIKNNSDGIALAIENTRNPYTGETVSITPADESTPLKDLFFIVVEDDEFGWPVTTHGCAAQDT